MEDRTVQHGFRDAIDMAIKNEAVRRIEVDFAAVEHLDSMTLGRLLVLRDEASSGENEVALVNCHGGVKTVLDIANFAKLFSINETSGAANWRPRSIY